jgi:hypothetical protein
MMHLLYQLASSNPMSTINVLLVGEAFMAYTERPPMPQFVTFHCRRKEKNGCLGPFNHDKKKLQSCQIQECKRKENPNKAALEKRKKKNQN